MVQRGVDGGEELPRLWAHLDGPRREEAHGEADCEGDEERDQLRTGGGSDGLWVGEGDRVLGGVESRDVAARGGGEPTPGGEVEESGGGFSVGHRGKGRREVMLPYRDRGHKRHFAWFITGKWSNINKIMQSGQITKKLTNWRAKNVLRREGV